MLFILVDFVGILCCLDKGIEVNVPGNAKSMMQVMEWMDLERNAAILEKTDKAIAQKLRAASGGKVE